MLLQWISAVLSRLAPGLAGRLAERIFVTPIRTRRPPRERAWAENAVRLAISSPLGPIPVWVWGEGPQTVMLVHGWSGRGLQLGAFVAPLVERGLRVVAHDAPGHGEARGRTSSMPALAAALGAVGRRFGPPAAIIAHSLGSTATIHALAERELMTDRVVAIAPASRLHAIRDRFGAMTGFPPFVMERMRKGLERRLGFDWDGAEPLRIAPRMAVPMLVIHDAGDRFIPHSEGVELAEAWPDGRLVTTTNLGHHRVLRDDRVIGRVVAFITEPIANELMERRAS